MNVKRIDPAKLQEELIRREAVEMAADFKAFVLGAWDIVEPGSAFLDGMHIDAICDHLQACQKRQIKKLLVTVPPRHSKSTLISVLYPVWLWTHTPEERILSGSYSLSLATGDAVKARRVVTSEWFKARWPVTIQADADQKQFYQNTRMGQRQVTSVGGTTTGLGGSHLILDDPHNVQMADSAVVRQQTLQWYRESWSTRANTPDTVRVVVQQRVHMKDTAGYCIEEGDWDHLNLPCEYEGRKIITSIGWSDPRELDGDLLWPSRYDAKEVASIKRTLGSAAYAGQFQQRPTARGGATFKKEWVRFWYDDAQGIPDPYVVQKSNGEMMECPQRPRPPIDEAGKLQSWDLSFKGGADNDYVVGQLWGTAKDARSHFYLLDQERGQMDFVATVAGIRRLQDRSPANATIVEDKANGAAVIASLKAEIPGLIPVNPQGGKESRASACAPLFEAGQVWLPHPGQYPWVEEFIEELCSFPRGAHDDQVDAMTQALARMREKRIDDIAEDAFMVDSHRRLSPWSGL